MVLAYEERFTELYICIKVFTLVEDNKLNKQ